MSARPDETIPADVLKLAHEAVCAALRDKQCLNVIQMTVGMGAKSSQVALKEAFARAIMADRATRESRVREEAELTPAVAHVLAERERQKIVEGWMPEHDDRHTDGALAKAAVCYATVYQLGACYWPWDLRWWKPKDRRHDLVRAGALILAEIERLDRAALRAHQPEPRQGDAGDRT